MKGRKPAPTAIKRLRGDKPSRINENEPKIVPNFPGCPRFLGKEARVEFFRIKKEMRACSYISTLDRGILINYCVAWENFTKSYGMVQKFGPFIKTKKGNIVQNPALSGINKAMEQMAKFSAELGFSPSSRGRISVPVNPDKPTSGMAAMLD